jgi:hypothetical protein
MVSIDMSKFVVYQMDLAAHPILEQYARNLFGDEVVDEGNILNAQLEFKKLYMCHSDEDCRKCGGCVAAPVLIDCSKQACKTCPDKCEPYLEWELDDIVGRGDVN